MEDRIVNHVHSTFYWLIEKLGFVIIDEFNDRQSYFIIYRSSVFEIRLEKYRRQFYATLCKTHQPGQEVNLFNLLSYINQDSSDVPTSNYFDAEQDLDECYKRQLTYLAEIIYDNFYSFNSFFDHANYVLNIDNLEKFILNKYPNLFKRS